MGGGELRCFVALRLGPDACAALTPAIERLSRHRAAVRWVRPENLHMTLAFLGAVPRARVEEVVAALGGVPTPPSLQLGVAGLGSFPQNRPARVLWAGLCGDLEPLQRLGRSIEAALAALGFALEQRPFRPHVTIGRVKRPRGIETVVAEMERLRIESAPAPIRAFALYASTLGEAGPTYDELQSFGIGGGG